MAAVDTIGSLMFNGGSFTGSSTLTLASPALTALSIGDGVTLSIPTTFSSSGGLTYTGTTTGSTISGALNLGTSLAHTFNINDGAASIDLDISEVISGTGAAITKTTGLGTLQFSGSGANTYTGTTTVTAGSLILNKSPNTVAIAGNTTINGGTLKLGASNQFGSASIVNLSSGTFDLNGNNATLSAFTYTGGTFTQGGGTLSLSSNGTALTMRDTTISGPLALTGGGSIVFDNTNNGTATLSGSVDLGDW
jgi:fibronectin-binding autotransporter adhesin